MASGSPPAWTLPPTAPTGSSPPDEPFVPPRIPPRPPEPSSWTPLFLLFLSFLGFIGFAYLLYSFKFDGVTATWDGFPTRVAFVVFLTLIVAPFLLTIFRRVPVLYLAFPVVLIFFIYPIFSPFGLPYSQDTIFNLQFAQAIFSSGTWQPLAGVVGQAGGL